MIFLDSMESFRAVSAMARKVRVQYLDAYYHVFNRDG